MRRQGDDRHVYYRMWWQGALLARCKQPAYTRRYFFHCPGANGESPVDLPNVTHAKITQVMYDTFETKPYASRAFSPNFPNDSLFNLMLLKPSPFSKLLNFFKILLAGGLSPFSTTSVGRIVSCNRMLLRTRSFCGSINCNRTPPMQLGVLVKAETVASIMKADKNNTFIIIFGIRRRKKDALWLG